MFFGQAGFTPLIRSFVVVILLLCFQSGNYNPAGRLFFCYAEINVQIAVGGVCDNDGIISYTHA